MFFRDSNKVISNKKRKSFLFMTIHGLKKIKKKSFLFMTTNGIENIVNDKTEFFAIKMYIR